jgi:hypothetical protein
MIPAILVLGKYIYKYNNKNHYICHPNKTNTTKKYLVPYTIKPSFAKVSINYYILINYTETDEDIIYCTLIETLGPVTDLNAFDRYQMHCYNLVNKVKIFPIEDIKNRQLFSLTDPELIMNIHREVYTIDSEETTDFDDAFSIQNDILSIYIINVAYYIKYIEDLPNYIDTMLSSTVYLGNRVSMIPKISRELTLIKDSLRVVITLDINILTGETKLYNSLVKIKENLRYSDKHRIIKELINVTSTPDSYKAVEHLMTTINLYCAKLNSNFIYMATGDKIDNNYVDYAIYKSYYTKNKEPNLLFNDYYIHISSPIRRIVDLINQLIFEKYELDVSVDKINNSQKSIKKIQTRSRLLRLFVKNPDTIYDGVVIPDTNTIYIPSIGLFYEDTTVPVDTKSFKIYIFENKNTYKQKIKVGSTDVSVVS